MGAALEGSGDGASGTASGGGEEGCREEGKRSPCCLEEGGGEGSKPGEAAES